MIISDFLFLLTFFALALRKVATSPQKSSHSSPNLIHFKNRPPKNTQTKTKTSFSTRLDSTCIKYSDRSMGATDSKLQFKTHIFRLFEEADIPADDDYWVQFWRQPESANDIFTLLTASDIRNTRDLHIENLETLLSAIISRLTYLYNNTAFPSIEIAPAKEVLNCLRILTRILPFIYEKKDHRMEEWENRFFWGNTSGNADDKPIAEKLIDMGVGLLFYSGFTIPKFQREQVVYTIWETGVGCSTPMTTTHEMQANRIEVLRFLLSICSDCLYTTPNALAADGSKYLTYLVTQMDKRAAMSILCSLLNITLKYYPGWKVPYDHMIISDRHRQLVTYSLQLLELLLVYLVPNGGRNLFRHYLSKIHRVQDLQFIADSLAKLLTQPILASTTYLPGSRREIQWVCELTMLFWDLTQCNKKFKSYLISSNRVHDFTVLLQYYIHDKRFDTSKQGFVRLCTYILLYLSSDESYAKSLSKPFEGQNSLPTAIKLPIFNGTYADYLVIQLLKSISGGAESNIDFMVATLLEVILNISPYVSNISYLTSSNMMHIFSSLSSPSFLLANERNQYIVGTFLQTLTLLLNCNFYSNRNLVFAMLRNSKIFFQLKQTLHSQINDEDNNEDSKGKQPQRSAEEEEEDEEKTKAIARLADLWALVDPLVMMIGSVKDGIQFPDDPSHHRGGSYEPHDMIESINSLSSVSGVELEPHEPTREEFEPNTFEWNPSSLGWYQSILWGNIYQHEHDYVTPTAITNPATMNTDANMQNVGVWNNTDIKLFKLQQMAPTGPSLMKPKGAVDALADTMIQKLGQFRSRE